MRSFFIYVFPLFFFKHFSTPFFLFLFFLYPKMTLVLPDNLLVIPLENKVLLPSVVLKISMRGKDAVTLTRKHLRASEQRKPTYVACIPLTSTTSVGDEPEIEGFIRPEDKDKLFDYGCAARILRVQRAGLGAFTMFIEGVVRFKVKDVVAQDNTLYAKVNYIEQQDLADDDDNMIRFKALVREFLIKMKELRMPENLIQQLTKLLDSVPPPVLADLLVTVIETSFDEKLTMLATTDVKKRLEKASEWMTRQLHVRFYYYYKHKISLFFSQGPQDI